MLVGRFQYHFSKIETALNLGIAKVLDLNEVARDIVCSNLDFVKKINIIKAAVTHQFVDQNNSLGDVLDRAAKINNPDRLESRSFVLGLRLHFHGINQNKITAHNPPNRKAAMPGVTIDSLIMRWRSIG